MEFAEGHAKPGNDLDCMVCWDTLNEETYIEYKISADSKWMPGMICETCVEHLRKTQYARYSELLQKSTCKAELRRLLTAGPPIRVREPQALPCPNDGEIHSLWFISDKKEHSALLEGALEGEARMKYWNELKEFWSKEDESTNDDEEGGKGKNNLKIDTTNKGVDNEEPKTKSPRI